MKNNLDKILKFDVDKIELIEEISNAQFAKAKVWCFATGVNSHKFDILLSALKLAEPTILQKPLTFAYDARRDDASNHSPSQVPCGFVPQDSKITYELSEDGRVFCCVEVLIWKYYSGRILEIFQKADGEKQVSVEINALEFIDQTDGSRAISAFVYRCITILGEAYNPSVKDAHAEIIEFSKAKEEYEKEYFSEVSVDEVSNDLILEGLNSNHDIDFNNKNTSKEDSVMKFDKVEFAKVCGMTADEMSEKLYNACRAVKYMDGEYESTRYYMRTYSAEYVFVHDYMTNKVMSIPYTMENGEVKMNFEGAKSARMTYVIDEEESENVVDELMELLKKLMSEKEVAFAEEKAGLEKAVEDEKLKFAEVETKFTEIEAKVTTLESEIESGKVSFAEIETENTTLKEFKANVEKTAKDNEIEFAIREVADDIGATKVDEWRSKANEYETVEAFSNAIKSFAYEMSKGKKGKVSKEEISRISLTTNAEPNKAEDGDVWSKLKNKIK